MKQKLLLFPRPVILDRAGISRLVPAIHKSGLIIVLIFLALSSVNATVALVNNPPVTVNESIQLCEGTTYTGNVLNGDMDPDGTFLSVSIVPVTAPSNGTFSVDAAGNFSYTPDAGYSGSDSVIVSICDAGFPVSACTNDTLFIHVDDFIPADAGFDQELCTAESTLLEGNDPLPGAGSWVLVSGPNNPVITPINPATASVTGLVADTIPFVFEYTVNNGSCSSSDTITIANYLPPSTSFAGFNQYLCLETPASFFMSANSPYTGTGHWNQIFGPGIAIFADSTDPATLVTGLLEGTYLFDWIITNGACSPSSSAFLLQITQPVTAFAGNDVTICETQSSYTLSSAIAANYQSLVWTTSGTGLFYNPTDLNPTYFPSASDIYAGGVILTLSATGNMLCPEASDEMLLNISNQATVNAGPDYSIYETELSFQLAVATANYFTSVIWTTSGDGTFSNPTSVNPDYFPGANDIISGSVTLTLSATSNSPCMTASDSMILLIIQNSSVNAGPDAGTCQGSPYTIAGSSAINYCSLAWSHNGTGALTAANTLNPTYLPSPSESGPIVLTLKVFSSPSCTDSIIDQMILMVYPLPTAILSGSSSACAGDTTMLRIDLTGSGPWNVTYTSGITVYTINNITASPYLFGVITTPGYTTYTLGTLTDVHCSATSAQLAGSVIVLGNLPPVSDFTANSLCAGDSAQYTSSTLVNMTTTQAWYWQFGDGHTSTLPDPLHVYALAGTYNVTLTISDITGCQGTSTKTIQVYAPPVASFTWTNSQFNTTIEFTGIHTGSGAALNAYSWNFGDSASQTEFYPNNIVSHTYAMAGNYTANLTLYDINGCSGTVSQIILCGSGPQVEINVTDSLVCQYSPVTVSISASTNIEQWILNWGDGTSPIVETSSHPVKTHAYTQPGDYTVSVKVKTLFNDKPVEDSVSCIIHVRQSPVAGFVATDQCMGEMTIFRDTTNTYGISLMRYSWNFGDPLSGADSSSASNPEYQYNSDGIYVANLIATNEFGCSDTAIRKVTVHGLPTAQFSNSIACHRNPTYFIDQSEPSVVPLTQWEWRIGKDKTEGSMNGQSPSFTFDLPVSYPVWLSVTDANGCRDTVSRDITVSSLPISAFSIEENHGHEQGKVLLKNGSIDGSKYIWEFGTGEISNEESPVATFTEDGSYTIRLTAENSNGCLDTTSFVYQMLFKGLYVPNAFAPEGSVGSDRFWKPAGENLAIYKVEVFSRWDGLVWSSTKLDENGSPAEGWDGTFNEMPCQQGVYIWRITAVFSDGTLWKNEDVGNRLNMPNLTTGTITLIR